MSKLLFSAYLSQRLDDEGNQTELPGDWRVDDFTTLMAPKASVAIEGREVKMASLRSAQICLRQTSYTVIHYLTY